VELCSIFMKYPATAGYFLHPIGALLHTHDGPLGPFMGTSWWTFRSIHVTIHLGQARLGQSWIIWAQRLIMQDIHLSADECNESCTIVLSTSVRVLIRADEIRNVVTRRGTQYEWTRIWVQRIISGHEWMGQPIVSDSERAKNERSEWCAVL
jgi:hypothetical protein